MKHSKTVIFDDGTEAPPPGPSLAGKHFADVLSGLTPEWVNEVVSHLSPAILQNCVNSTGTQHQTVLCRWQCSLVFQKLSMLSPTAAAAISSRLLPAAAV